MKAVANIFFSFATAPLLFVILSMITFMTAAVVAGAVVAFAVVMVVMHTAEIWPDFEFALHISFGRSFYISGCAAYDFYIGLTQGVDGAAANAAAY